MNVKRGTEITVCGYARASTIGQELEAQVQMLEQNGASVIYKEKFTGTKTGRPLFNELLNVLKEGDTLMVTKLDCFARSVSQGSDLIKDLISKEVKGRRGADIEVGYHPI